MVATDETIDRATATVADIALYFPQAIEVLNRYNLDYCCNGKKNFDDVCKQHNLNPEQIWFELLGTNVDSGTNNHMRFETWDLPLLIDFILQNHHQYVRESIPKIRELLDKVCNVHGDEQPELHKVRENFNSLAEELFAHMPKEEEILFPSINRIIQQNNGFIKSSTRLGNLNSPILVMEHEHETAGDLIKSIRSLTNGYTPPAFACPTYQITFKMLKEFDNDLMQHIHLENNILFPKAKMLSVK
ncbi:MAG: iron-sulfur cluster repair di-iron protein [Bacteroidota bacterium]